MKQFRTLEVSECRTHIEALIKEIEELQIPDTKHDIGTDGYHAYNCPACKWERLKYRWIR